MCRAIGPGKDEFESTKIIGINQFEAAFALWQNASVTLDSYVRYVHTYKDFHNITVDAKFSPTKKPGKTCIGALGDS
jgi:neutral ceramidase